MKKWLFRLFAFFSILIIVIITIFYFIQENLIFYPEKLNENAVYHFQDDFEELNIFTPDGEKINALLFTVPNSKGLIFFLHGNAASLKYIGSEAHPYTQMGYDVFMFDYPGFGKSSGTIINEDQLFEENQFLYDVMKKKYSEDKIILVGYSIGTGMASKLAQDNHPQQLILQAPYYSFSDLVKYKMPLMPQFFLKYKFETNEFLKNTKVPITIFHGEEDVVIYPESSQKLQNEIGEKVDLYYLPDQGHERIIENPIFLKVLQEKL